MVKQLLLYRGYFNNSTLVINGHLVDKIQYSPESLYASGYNYFKNILRRFRIKPLKNIPIELNFNGEKFTTKTLQDGEFKFIVPFPNTLGAGWHKCSVNTQIHQEVLHQEGEILKPHLSKYGIISDIDDTFLISYSGNLFKKLRVLLFKNVARREIFEGAAEHYLHLSMAGLNNDSSFNSFYYVSSSEWNLYPLIEEFRKIHHLPKAIIKLKDIKLGLLSFLQSGGGNHDHKFEKIKSIISFNSDLTYVLLGDDSQKDPFIYERIAKVFPINIKAIYIRKTKEKENIEVRKILDNIETMGINTLYFRDSHDAIDHSKAIGII